MALTPHAECKTAVLGLLEALSKIKTLAEGPKSADAATAHAIAQLAAQAVARHSPLLPKLE